MKIGNFVPTQSVTVSDEVRHQDINSPTSDIPFDRKLGCGYVQINWFSHRSAVVCSC